MRSLAFFRKFSLDRQRLSLMLSSISRNSAASDAEVGADMGVNPYMVTGFRGWLRKTGLGGGVSGMYALSPLGEMVVKCDPHLSDLGTLWLLHYYLVSEHEERAEVWYRCFNEFLSPSMEFTRAELQVYVERALESRPTNRGAIAEDCQALVNCYTQPSALRNLDVIAEVSKGTYQVGAGQPPDPHILGFVLFDSWQRRFPQHDTIRLSQVAQEPEMLGRVFVRGREQVLQALYNLESMGWVNVAASQHEPVTRRFRGEPIRLLEDYYAAL